jgi:hypothetical protein
MNDRQIMEAAIRHMENPVKPEDPRPFWRRLLSSLKVKISGVPPNKIEVTGNANF